MEIKLLELRDRATFIPAFAFRSEPDHDRERYLLRRAGYSMGEPLVILGRLEGDECHYDPYDWNCDPWRTVHHYLVQHWDEVNSGDVLDAEFIRGESQQPKKSEQVTTYD